MDYQDQRERSGEPDDAYSSVYITTNSASLTQFNVRVNSYMMSYIYNVQVYWMATLSQ